MSTVQPKTPKYIIQQNNRHLFTHTKTGNNLAEAWREKIFK